MKNIILIIVTLIFCFQLIDKEPVLAQTKQTITFGIIITHMAVSPVAIMEGTKPLCNYISKKLNVPVKAEIIPDVHTLISKLDDGTIQVGYVSNLDYIKIKQSRDIVPFAKVVKGGKSSYNAIMLVRKNSNVKSLADLKGKTFTYTSENSSHGFLYPSLLLKSKLNTNIKSFFKNPSLITKKDPDGILAVLYQKADIVGASSQTFAILAELMPRLKKELFVLDTSQPMVHGPMFIYPKNFKDKSIIEKLKTEVLNMDKTTEGKQVLLLFKIGGWTTASDADYDSMRQLLNTLGKKK